MDDKELLRETIQEWNELLRSIERKFGVRAYSTKNDAEGNPLWHYELKGKRSRRAYRSVPEAIVAGIAKLLMLLIFFAAVLAAVKLIF